MVLVYVDDILVVSHDTKEIMAKLSEIYQLKPGSVAPPIFRCNNQEAYAG
jgi:ABC-type molybdenum transport system ATPase subunit/photorepair protein PhrA